MAAVYLLIWDSSIHWTPYSTVISQSTQSKKGVKWKLMLSPAINIRFYTVGHKKEPTYFCL